MSLVNLFARFLKEKQFLSNILILIDVPLKSLAKVEDKKASLLYLPERVSGVRARKRT
jgi:hypothetical protein